MLETYWIDWIVDVFIIFHMNCLLTNGLGGYLKAFERMAKAYNPISDDCFMNKNKTRLIYDELLLSVQ